MGVGRVAHIQEQEEQCGQTVKACGRIIEETGGEGSVTVLAYLCK